MARSKRSSKRSSSNRSTRSTKKSTPRRPARQNRSQPARREPLLQLSRHQWAIIAGIVLIAVAGISALSGLGLSQGTLTERLWNAIWKGFGYGGVLVPLMFGGIGLYLVLWGMEQPPKLLWDRIGGAGLLFLALEGIFHLIGLIRNPDMPALHEDALLEGGGYLGGWLALVLEPAVGRWGGLMLCVALAAVGLVMLSGVTFAQLGRSLLKLPQVWRGRAQARPTRAISPIHQPAYPITDTAAAEARTPAPTETAVAPQGQPADQPIDSAQPGLFYGDAVQIAAAHYDWQLPAMADILEPGTESAVADAQIREQVEIIEHALRSFGAPGRVVEINRGPVITQYGVEPQYVEQRNGRRIKVKVGQINSLADDLALALAARSIRIEAPVPGKGFVGIEVPNAEVSLVSLRDVMEAEPFASIKSQLRLGLGQDVSGGAIAVDLAQMPHLLIAGATGSGKSVCVNSLVTCMLLQNTPAQLRLLMVDPKRVELTNYNGIPHLMMPVIVDLEKVVGALQWVTREMDGRYRRFAEVGARNIADFNRRADAAGREKLPYIVVVIDELADLMMMAPDETERTVCRLAQMARATGIHLLIATQRPSVDVVTGLIKANFPARIAFAVASSTDSRVILDTTGAERLLGRGDMLLMSPDAAQPLRMQGCFVSDQELRRLVDFWRRQRLAAVQAGKAARTRAPAKGEGEEEEIPDPEPAPPLQQPLWEEVIQLEKEASEQDELLDEAIAVVRELGKASVSLLQRRLRIGYTRAARLIDTMEELGVVGPHPGGSRQREVLSPPDSPAGDEQGID
jgi:S-DNA-T family DNA segregation ATPase FtsK/SpoIIIE